MKRTSLAQKITTCLKYGTINTYNMTDACTYMADVYGDDSHTGEVVKAYAKGLVLCRFKSGNEDIETVSQLNTLDKFISNIVWYEVLPIHSR